MQTQDSTIIVGRFFLAIAKLKEEKRIRGMATFCRRYEINRRNMYQLEKDHSRDIFQPAWLTYLVNDYSVSAEWLLTGKGSALNRPVEQQKRKVKKHNISTQKNVGL